MKREASARRRRSRLKAWGGGTAVLLALALPGAATAVESLPATPNLREADAKLMQAAQQGNPASVKAAVAEGANLDFHGPAW